ncbi:MAG: DUF748 domain-containing protein, partial [Thermodesulfobacteriota bacterium]
MRLTGATLELLRGDEATPLGVDAEVRSLSSDAGARSELSLELTPPQGTIEVAGGVVQEPLAFDGTVRFAGVSLPALLAPVEQPAAALLRGGVLDADLTVALGPPSGAGDEAARIRGTATLAGVDVSDPGSAGDAFGLAWKSLALDVREALVPAALGGERTEPIRATLDGVELIEPSVRVTRTERGIVLPAALGEAPEASAPAGPAAA